uniref:Uncharacterized protein n=1 Tax=Peronospora matthiolae TaxID=2874970 RepID=A0AAV1U6G6_9STRA
MGCLPAAKLSHKAGYGELTLLVPLFLVRYVGGASLCAIIVVFEETVVKA